jgi:colicin import membrane protein
VDACVAQVKEAKLDSQTEKSLMDGCATKMDATKEALAKAKAEQKQKALADAAKQKAAEDAKQKAAADQKKAAQEKAEREKRLAQQKADAEKKRKAEEAKRIAEEKAIAEAKQKAAAEARRQAAREAAEKTVASFAGQFVSSLNDKWIRPATARNGMEAVVEVRLFPSGEVDNVSVLKSSGDAGFDRSAENAVFRAAPFALAKQIDSALFDRELRRIRVTFRPEGLRW